LVGDINAATETPSITENLQTPAAVPAEDAGKEPAAG